MSDSSIPSKPFKDEDLSSPSVSKRALLTFVSENADPEFLKGCGLNGKVDDIIRDLHKDKIVQAYKDLYTSGSFKKASNDLAKEVVTSEDTASAPASIKNEKEPILYTKQQMKKGDKVNFSS
ncbi:FK506-binding protein 2B [Entomophthora muscae]|uniref:FK506-binding protein 2B n=1 Tax=Entomophthora muscae TaxID=34485 RepID=A0ACC2RDR5_9FUNG|nr:FK506-binding protein 2B [Entomophthora muscae]